MFFFQCFCQIVCLFFFFFNDTATTEIYTLSLHDALPIYACVFALPPMLGLHHGDPAQIIGPRGGIYRHIVLDEHVDAEDRKSTRLNSSHQIISYAVFCLKKKKKDRHTNVLRATSQSQYRN